MTPSIRALIERVLGGPSALHVDDDGQDQRALARAVPDELGELVVQVALEQLVLAHAVGVEAVEDRARVRAHLVEQLVGRVGALGGEAAGDDLGLDARRARGGAGRR